VEGYRRHVGHRHLDVGPGTGYFPEPAGLPEGSRLTLCREVPAARRPGRPRAAWLPPDSGATTDTRGRPVDHRTGSRPLRAVRVRSGVDRSARRRV